MKNLTQQILGKAPQRFNKLLYSLLNDKKYAQKIWS